MTKQMTESMLTDLSWEKFKPIFIDVYSHTFTDAELNGMIEFYQTPTGQSVVTKLPQVMQRTMVAMQPMMKDMMQKAQKRVTQFVSDLQAKRTGKTG